MFQLKNHFKIVKEILRHLLRRPVVGIAAAARTSDGRWVLIRRGDTGQWALPGGTLEWGETLRQAILRELAEETGIVEVSLGDVIGVYSDPDRDQRFHAVTVVVAASVSEPVRPPLNPAEVLEVGLFADAELPQTLAYDMTQMLQNAQNGRSFWE